MAHKDPAESGAAASSSIQEVRHVAKQITQHCLRRWDGWLGIRAGSDITGGKAGIWRGQFEGVRCAVLLLVFYRLNEQLQAQVDSPGQPMLLLDQPNNRALLQFSTQIASRLCGFLGCAVCQSELSQGA